MRAKAKGHLQHPRRFLNDTGFQQNCQGFSLGSQDYLFLRDKLKNRELFIPAM